MSALRPARPAGEREPPRFRRLTFQRGDLWAARFAPDGRTVVYTAEWNGEAPAIFTSSLDRPEPRPLGLRDARLLAVSPRGDLAVALRDRPQTTGQRYGTLARVPLGGETAPRELAEDVWQADWLPDGEQLAATRRAGRGVQVEFPLGRVVYTSPYSIDDLRVSPDGQRVAFAAYAAGRRPQIKVADLAGAVRDLETRAGNTVFAWSPSGDEVWVAGLDGALEALPLRPGGARRLIARTPDPLDVHDVAPDGRALVSPRRWRVEALGVAQGEAGARNLSWLGQSHPRGLSADGKLLLLEEVEERDWGPAGAYLRPTDGGPAVRIADGMPLALSADGKWAIVRGRAEEAGIALVPTGPGAARPLPRGAIARFEAAAFLSDGRRLLLAGSAEGRPPRTWLQPADGSAAPRPITPEGTTATDAVAPDGTRFVSRTPEGRYAVQPLDGGPAVPIALAEVEVPVAFTADGRGLYLRTSAVPTQLLEIDLASLRRRQVRALGPADRAGVFQVGGHVRITPDGRMCVYDYFRSLTELFLAEGLR